MAVAAVERVGIGDKLHERTSRLSGGEQQRVALARLLVQRPGIVLADEPVASLDPTRADDIVRLLTAIVDESGNTLIASLHSVDLARRYFTRAIGLRDGRLQFDVDMDGARGWDAPRTLRPRIGGRSVSTRVSSAARGCSPP